LLINSIHKLSISLGRRFLAAFVFAVLGSVTNAQNSSCTAALGAPALASGPLKTLGTQSTTVDFAVRPGHDYLIEVEERGNDARVEVVDSRGLMRVRADHPERRTGTRRALVSAAAPAMSVRVTGKEDANASGEVTVRAFDLAALGIRADCRVILKALAQADGDFAAGEEIVAGHPSRASARDTFLRAAAGYSAAESALTAPADRPLRGQTQLALAALQYHNLQDWAQTARWAAAASETLAGEDLYRSARAKALAAAAWMEMGSSGANSAQLLTRARATLQSLSRFFLARGERYDAGLQLSNVTLTYYFQGRYLECLTAADRAGRLFDSIHDTQRRAQARNNRALCLWGLGRLPEALHEFERVMQDVGPDSLGGLYLGVTNNMALLDYALGHFDESLRLFNRALEFARKAQARRDEAQCLYGIGVTYYAIGDRDSARRSLEASLAIRTEELDGRGRLSTLRSLATLEADDKRPLEAVRLDQAALGLAVSPSAIERITIQLASHTAAAGRPEEGLAQLNAVLGQRVGGDPLIREEGRLQRAMLLEALGRPRDALADLQRARPRLHALGSVTDEFAADLELARARRALGQSAAALAAVDLALAHADALRLQTANPELRAQLQAPLRPAYDLKLELLRERFDRAMAAGRHKEADALAAAAFITADTARAHSFADVAAESYPPALRASLAPELRRREELYVELAARRFALDARVDGSGSADPRAQHLVADIAELQRQADIVNTLIAERAAPARAARRGGEQPPNLPAVPADTAIVSYWLGSSSAYAWVVLPDSVHWAHLSASAVIAKGTLAFHHSLTQLGHPPAGRLADGLALYDLILRPLEPWLSAVRQWIVIPDGALDYVPFAALRVTDAKASFVVMQHDVAFTPAAWMLHSAAASTQPHEPGGLLLVADPVYQADDPRLAPLRKAPPAGKTPDEPTLDPRAYQRLPYTAEEAAQISAQFPRAEVFELTGLDATRARLLALDWSKYRFIHIATHGVADAQVPGLSALILGAYDEHGNKVDGAVRVADLSLLTLNADVAVLSACDTALGHEVQSEGLVGVGSTMLARGAQAVVASLWPVSDEIGARLMTEFYRYLLKDSMSPAAALARSMRSAVSRDESADPALWAAFQVSIVAFGPGLPSAASLQGGLPPGLRR
jgi:CHAT domain-containing protein/tetratricopeptide (TPR) repeat protein